VGHRTWRDRNRDLTPTLILDVHNEEPGLMETIDGLVLNVRNTPAIRRDLEKKKGSLAESVGGRSVNRLGSGSTGGKVKVRAQ
jgi:hypothetical protein